jgi:hypothetical protein
LQKQTSTKGHIKKILRVRGTKDGRGSSLFAMEDIEKDDYVLEYVGKINRKEGRTIT